MCVLHLTKTHTSMSLNTNDQLATMCRFGEQTEKNYDSEIWS